MRVALISDLHANLVALQAVLADIRRVGADQIVCLGDVATLGPAPGAVLQLLRDLRCPCILGNHDAFLLDAALISGYTEAQVVVDAVDWCRAQLSDEDLRFLRSFVPGAEIALEERTTLQLFHGTPRSHMENLLSTTAPGELDELLGGHRAQVMAGGHTHLQMLRQHRGILIVNPGSVGMPFREFVVGRAPTVLDHAEYATVEASGGAVNVTLRRVALSRSELHQAAGSSSHPLRAMLQAQYA